MRMKPKSTVHNPRALLYKRYTDLETSFALKALYITSDNKAWIFDIETQGFLPYEGDRSVFGTNVINVSTTDSAFDIITYKNTYFYYAMNFALTRGVWVQSPQKPLSSPLVVSATTEVYEAKKITEVPPEYVLAAQESIDVQFDGNKTFYAKIEITNALGETAIYEGTRQKNEGSSPFELPLVEVREKGNAPNTVISIFSVE